MGSARTVTRIRTVQQHILDQQRRLHPDATGEFSWLLSGITLATKIIADHVRRAGLVDLLGTTGDINVVDRAHAVTQVIEDLLLSSGIKVLLRIRVTMNRCVTVHNDFYEFELRQSTSFV